MTSKRNMTKLIMKNGLECYDFVKKKKVNWSNFCEKIQELDQKIFQEWIDEYRQDSYKSYYRFYTKLDCIDEVLENNLDKYEHLRSIRDVVKMDTIVDKILDDKIYQKAISIYYGRLLFQKIFESRPILEIEYLPLIEEEKNSFFELVMKKIDNYYINMITR